MSSHLYVRHSGSWVHIVKPQKVRFGGVWKEVKRLYVRHSGTWNLVMTGATPTIFPPGKNISTGFGIGPNHAVDVSWTVNTNSATDEFYFDVRVEIWKGGVLTDAQQVSQATGTIHSSSGLADGDVVFGRLSYVNADTGLAGPTTDTSNITVAG